jgi:hypothetical protein
VPSGSLAVAVSSMEAGATKLAPLVGEVNETVGAAFATTVIELVREVAVAPRSSVATAFTT